MSPNRYTPASDMARISASMSSDLLLIGLITLFSIICLGAAVVAMPERWEATRAEGRPT